MFKELNKLINSQDWFNTSPEIEILKGWYKKSDNLKESIQKMNRKYKFKK